MTTFKEYLTEVFDKPYTFREMINNNRQSVYRFQTKTDTITVHFFIKGGPSDSIWEMSFTDKGGSEMATGKGDEFKTFSTVLSITKDFINKHPVKMLMIIATKQEAGADTGRIKLYKRMIERELPKNWKTDIQTADSTYDDGSVVFILKNLSYKAKQ